MASNDALHGREAETVPGVLRGEERVENPAQRFVIHAGAVVAHLETRRCPARRQERRDGAE